jgi:hypothetical protein
MARATKILIISYLFWLSKVLPQVLLLLKLITKKVEDLLEKIAHMSTAKKTDYNAFLDSINKGEI